jgi:NOL1/NOP2/sun family putative RNA methylase
MSEDINNRDLIYELAEENNYSQFMVQELMKNFPTDYKQIMKAFEKPPFQTIRVNTLKTTPELLKADLAKKAYRFKPAGSIPYALNVSSAKSKIEIGATHEYLRGLYYIQSYGSMIPVYLLYPEPEDRVLDMCAAPGSKTTQIGQLMNQEGIIVATDIKKSRLNSLISNVKRCGVKNCIIFPYDATQLKKIIKTTLKPNKILLDAPCTGSGLLRIDKANKKTQNIKSITRLSRIQKQLLKEGLEMLEPGGRLMYSTCSFHYQENEQVIAETIQNFDDVKIIEPFDTTIGLPGLTSVENIDFGYDMVKTRRLYPNVHDSDAFFYCLMEKA